MERDSNDLNANTGASRDAGDAGSIGGTRNTGGAGSYGAGAGTSNTGSAGIGGTSGLGGSANTGSGSAGYDTGGAGHTNYGSTGATQSAAGAGLGLGGASEGEGRTDRLKGAAQDRAEMAREKLGEAGTKARDMKSKLEQTLADRLEAGASKLRERGSSGAGTGTMTPAYAGGSAPAATAADGSAGGAQANVAKGMEATAEWLRNGDLKGTIETQARTNPGRTLLVALGVGYLLGKAIRR